VHTKLPHPRLPVADYLRKQGRFAHLFRPSGETMLAEIQAQVDAYWAAVKE
jgi:pyruvate ferredoxin oxidoreductase beta subunit